MKVCVLAYNSVVSDARILKEADSLAKMGHDVTIYGLRDNRADKDSYVRASGVRIVLIDIRKIMRKISEGLSYFAKLGREVGLVVAGLLFMYVSFNFERALEFVDRHNAAFYFAGALLLLGWRLKVNWSAIKKVLNLLEIGGSASGRNAPQPSRPSVRTLFLTYFGNRLKVEMLARVARRHAPDVIHCHDLMTLPAGAAARRATGAKLVWDAHEIYEEIAQGTEAQRSKYRRILRAYQGYVDRFITINDSIASFYRENYPALPPALIVKNATVPAPPVAYDGRLHRAAALPADQKILLYQGGFAEKRGLRSLVAAARYLGSDWTLVMMGWGRIEADLRAIAEEVMAVTVGRTVPAVCFLPAAPHAELAQWTAGATVGTIPYERVGLNHLYCTPNKLWEYPAAGVPFLCSPLVEMSKVVEMHGVGWFLPDPATPEGIADAVNALTDEDIGQAKAACSVYIAADNWSVYESRLKSLYEGMLPGGADTERPPLPYTVSVQSPAQTEARSPARLS